VCARQSSICVRCSFISVSLLHLSNACLLSSTCDHSSSNWSWTSVSHYHGLRLFLSRHRGYPKRYCLYFGTKKKILEDGWFSASSPAETHHLRMASISLMLARWPWLPLQTKKPLQNFIVSIYDNASLLILQDMQLTDIGRALPIVIVIGKVSRGSSKLVDRCIFDVDIMQYGIIP